DIPNPLIPSAADMGPELLLNMRDGISLPQRPQMLNATILENGELDPATTNLVHQNFSKLIKSREMQRLADLGPDGFMEWLTASDTELARFTRSRFQYLADDPSIHIPDSKEAGTVSAGDTAMRDKAWRGWAERQHQSMRELTGENPD